MQSLHYPCLCRAALTNYKNALVQICRRLQRREFALDVAIALSDMPDLAKRVLLKQPLSDVPREVINAPEYSLTGEVVANFSEGHRLFSKIKNSWSEAVQSVFALLTGSDEWPVEGAPDGYVESALHFNAAGVKLYRGLKVSVPDICNTTLRCTPNFHGRPRQDSVLLFGDDDATYDDVQTMEYGLVHCFFSYRHADLDRLLVWGAQKFAMDYGEETLKKYSQFFLMQRYRPCAVGNAALPLGSLYAAKALSDVYETEPVSVIRNRARAQAWFHGTKAGVDDFKKKKGAIFGVFH